MATVINPFRKSGFSNNNANTGFETPDNRNVNLFEMIDSTVRLDSLFEDGIPVRFIPRLLWIFCLALLYIANSHYANKTVKELNKTKAEVEELRVDYTTHKAEYMETSKQSKVASNVAAFGLEESSVPPRKIVLESK